MQAQAWLSAQQPKMTADLIELANQNSGSTNLEGLLRVADWLEQWMDFSGVACQRVHLPPRHVVNDEGDELAIDSAPLLRWDFQPECERRVLLAIHYDTVFQPDSPFQSCEWIDADRLQGPGVADAKGGIVVLRYALHALQQFGLDRNCGWTVVLNPDEEIGSLSSSAAMAAMAADFDFGLLFEPCLPTGELVSTRKGSGNFDIVVRGKAAHAGRHFEEGRNAVAELSRLLWQLHELNGKRPGTTINVGAVRGGGPVNVVPDRAIGRVNVRIEDETSGAWFERELTKMVAAVNSREGFSCRSYGGVTSPPKLQTESLRQLMHALELAVLTVGESPVRWKSTGGVCDGNKLAAAGLPNIDTLGPIGDGLHSTKEWVQPSSLVHKSAIIVNLMSRFASGEFAELTRGHWDTK